MKTNSKINNYLKHKLQNNDVEIGFNELADIGIEHNEVTFELNENIVLERVQYFKSFKISYKDKKRNYDNKLLDDYIDSEAVIKSLSDYKLTNKKYSEFKKSRQAEVEWNKDLENHFKTYFLNVHRGNPNKSLEIDIDLGSGKVGLELKWADKINKNHPMNNVVGQIGGYKRNGNYKSLFLVVAGVVDLKQDVLILELENRVRDELGCNFVFIEIV